VNNERLRSGGKMTRNTMGRLHVCLRQIDAAVNVQPIVAV